MIPATYGDKPVFGSISHLTVDFETVLKEEMSGIRSRAEAAYEKHRGSEREAFAESCLNCIKAFEIWHGRYLYALQNRPEYQQNYKNLRRVPFAPATSFYEAVQSLWFTFAFIRLCGNWPGIGRIDWLLGDYLKKDLESGKLTLDEAREILAHFFIKGCEWVNGQYIGSGDAQHYQNIVLGGVDRNGEDVTNEVTYLVLDILEELSIGDFPTTVRLSKNTDEKLLRRVAEVMRFGGGILAVYNEDLILDALVKDGYEAREARAFANDGCWEVQIPGKTYFIYSPFDSLQILQKQTLREYDETVDFANFEELYQQYISDLHTQVEAIFLGRQKKFGSSDVPGEAWKWAKQQPCTVVSLFEQGVHDFTQTHMFSREKCRLCFACASICPTAALEPCGREMSIAEILSAVKKDEAFYGDQGGVTLSGGEPLAQGETAVELLKACKEHRLSTAVETCGYVDPAMIRAAAPYVDLFLWDIKDTDSPRHKQYTGVDNKKILENLSIANSLGAKIRLRCILVNGVNTDRKHYEALAQIAQEIQNFDGLEILPYHAYGGTKSTFIGLADSGRTEWIPTEQQILEAKNVFNLKGVKVHS